MKIVEEREAWIHTQFILDSFFITAQECRQISMNVEPELGQLGLQYGLMYDIAPSKHRAIIVLECIPFDSVKAMVKELINDVIKDFPVRLPNSGTLSPISVSQRISKTNYLCGRYENCLIDHVNP